MSMLINLPTSEWPGAKASEMCVQCLGTIRREDEWAGLIEDSRKLGISSKT